MTVTVLNAQNFKKFKKTGKSKLKYTLGKKRLICCQF